jgi:hypothetical protein
METRLFGTFIKFFLIFMQDSGNTYSFGLHADIARHSEDPSAVHMTIFHTRKDASQAASQEIERFDRAVVRFINECIIGWTLSRPLTPTLSPAEERGGEGGLKCPAHFEKINKSRCAAAHVFHQFARRDIRRSWGNLIQLIGRGWDTGSRAGPLWPADPLRKTASG